MKYLAKEIKNWDSEVGIESNGQTHWLPARPENYKHESLIRRASHAWGVFIGKYDALDWSDRHFKYSRKRKSK